MSDEINNENKDAVAAELPKVEAPIVEEKAEDVKPVEEAVKAEEPVKEEAKAEVAEVVSAPEKPKEVRGLGPVENGAMGSTTFVKKEEKKPVAKKVDKKETVAVYSTRNVTWNGVGKVYIGYNIVSKEASELWLKRDHVRLATPEEVAKEFGQ
jgi:outer membrane biosynthesis protein TonB